MKFLTWLTAALLAPNLASAAGDYESGASGTASCTIPVDVLLAVDNTMSMSGTITEVKQHLPQLLNSMKDTISDFQVALVSFNDKAFPCSRSGYSNYCNRLEMPLTTEIDAVSQKLQEFYARYGDEMLPEDSLGVLAQHSLNAAVGWRTTTSPLLKFIIVVTDNTYRFPGDMAEGTAFPNPDCAALPDNNGDSDYRCNAEKYYSEQQVAANIKQGGVVPIFLVPEHFVDSYETFLKHSDVLGYVRPMMADASDIVPLITQIMQDAACTGTLEPDHPLPGGPTTTPEPSSDTTDETTTKDVPFAPAGGRGGNKKAVAVGAAAGGAAALAGLAGLAAYRRSASTRMRAPLAEDLEETEGAAEQRERDQYAAVEEEQYV